MSLARAQTLTVRSGDERINQVTMRTPRLFVPTLTLVKNILIGILWTYQFFFIFVCSLADSDQLSLFWSKIPFNPGLALTGKEQLSPQEKHHIALLQAAGCS